MTVLEEHTFGTPLGNYGTPSGVRYTGFTSTALEHHLQDGKLFAYIGFTSEFMLR